MRYGVEIVTLGRLAEPTTVVDLAAAAEESGFELVAVWDHHAFVWGVPSGDPLVILSAVAQATRRALLLPFVMPMPRYRPHVLAYQLAALDRLSKGRLVLGAGLGGVADELTVFGDSGDAHERAEQTDEALEVITSLWSGAPVSHHGRYFGFDGVSLAPLPVQTPRPRIWIGGESAGALRRAARWDGWGVTCVDQEGRMVKAPSEIGQVVRRLGVEGARIGQGFEVTISGVTHGPGKVDPRPYAIAGATWWLEAIAPTFGDQQELMRRVRSGPPG